MIEARLPDHLKSLGMGAYLYAPKEDICHRYAWRQDYDESWINNFRFFCKRAHEGDIAAIAGSPQGWIMISAISIMVRIGIIYCENVRSC